MKKTMLSKDDILKDTVGHNMQSHRDTEKINDPADVLLILIFHIAADIICHQQGKTHHTIETQLIGKLKKTHRKQAQHHKSLDTADFKLQTPVDGQDKYRRRARSVARNAEN